MQYILVLFDGEDSHYRNGSGNTLLIKGLMFSYGEVCEGAHAFDEFFLVMVTLEPDLTIGVGVGKSLEEEVKAFLTKIDGTDNICNRIKS